ncbi:MAG: hypothetical protein RR740_00705 [Pseudomonas sp.]
MKTPLWFQALCTKRYNKRQQAILRETAELYHARHCLPPPEPHPRQRVTRIH